MIVQAFMRKCPFKQESEDAYVLNQSANIFGVFDGVTPIITYQDESGHNGAYIAANMFSNHFESVSGSVELSVELDRANRSLYEKMRAANVDTTIRHGLWSTCAAVVHIGEEQVSYAQLGDCIVAVQDKDGQIKVLTADQVKGNAARAAAKRKADRIRGIFVPEESYFDEGFNRMAYSRWMANTPEGYGVANGMQDMVHYIQSGSIAKETLKNVLIVSDGMFEDENELDTMFRQVLDIGFEQYMSDREVMELQSDLRPDDKTGILISF